MNAKKTPSWWLGLFTSIVILALSAAALLMNYVGFGVFSDEVKMSVLQQIMWWILALYGIFRLIMVVRSR